MQVTILVGCVLSLILAQIVSAQQIIEYFDMYEGERQPVHSLAAPFLVQMNRIPHWIFGENTIIADEVVKLTANEKSQRGWIANDRPLNFRDWEVYFSFRIDNGRNMGADGMALWLTNTPSFNPGPIWGGPTKWRGALIAFDTFDNDRNYDTPAISLIVNDDTWALNSGTDASPSGRVSGSCQVNFRSRDAEVRLGYLNGVLQLLYRIDGREWQLCFQQNMPIDFQPYIAFSAATGDITDAHEIRTVQTRKLVPKSGQAGNNPNQMRDAQPVKDLNLPTGQPETAHGYKAESQIIAELRKYERAYPQEIAENREWMRQQLLDAHKKEDIIADLYTDQNQQQKNNQQNQQQQYQQNKQNNQQQQYQNNQQQQQQNNQQQYQQNNPYQYQQPINNAQLDAVQNTQQNLANSISNLAAELKQARDSIARIENTLSRLSSSGLPGNVPNNNNDATRRTLDQIVEKTESSISRLTGIENKLQLTLDNANRFQSTIKRAGSEVATALTDAQPSSFTFWLYFALTQAVFACAWFIFAKASRKKTAFY